MASGAAMPGLRSGSETGPLTLRRLRSALSSWRASIRATDLLAAGVLVALAIGAGAYTYARARTAARLDFASQAERLLASINESLSRPLEDLRALQSFLGVSGGVTRKEFRSLVVPMLRRHLQVYAFEWLPVVLDEQRSDFEAEARESGLPGYHFWDLGADGKAVPAPRRPSYVPIYYMEPPSALALGLDVSTERGRSSVAERARDTGDVTASSPFQLVQDSGRPDAPRAIGLYAPVYREGDPGFEAARRTSLSGFAMVVFRVGPVVETAARTTNAPGLAFILRDADADTAATLAEMPAAAARLRRRKGFDQHFLVGFADRQWALEAFALPGGFLPASRGSIAIAAGGIMAVLFALGMVTSMRTISRLRRQAERVGPYRLVRRLGQGAMGVVWEARHDLLRRPTAVKLLAPGTEGERALARFEREVQLTAGLTHPSTIAIYDYGRTRDGVFYYAMELLRGINLLQLVGIDGPLPAPRVVHLLRQACGALAEAHQAGLIHRDVKPANLMVCIQGGIPDFLKVLDFGLVKEIGSIDREPEGRAPDAPRDAGLSQDGSLLGTPLYMAPEAMSDPATLDLRADLFALGSVGYFLLTGSSPFPGRTAIEVFAMEKKGPVPVSQAAPRPVPIGLADVIGRCLSFDRQERPSGAEELDAMLEGCGAGTWSREDAQAWWAMRGLATVQASAVRREESSGGALVVSTDERLPGSPAAAFDIE
jgi:serine/threonine-protein kinase